MATTADSVNAIIAIFSEAEGLADQFRAKMDEIPAHLGEINGNGDAGSLITEAMSLRAEALGLWIVAHTRALHSDMTEAARSREIDVAERPGSTRSGGGR